MFGKNNFSGFLGKGSFGSRIVGAGKALAHVLDEPIVQAGVSAFAPEVGAAIAGAKRYGLLERLKH